MQVQPKRLFFYSTIVLLLSAKLFASEGHASAHGEHEGVPTVVLYQAINVGIIALGLFFMLRHKATAFFSAKRQEYLEAQERAKFALLNAQKEHHDVHTKLTKLEANKQETLIRAKADAAEIRKQLLVDAENVIKRVKEEAALSAKIETERAINALREQLLKEAFEIANKEIANKATKEDQLRLQQDFINKVQVVQ